ncbi:hypothetical protein MIMGU_mgv11b002100mg [Erythranthe guttata]|uniref:Filament-like plant protein 7 n=1 Tax=Erythranthe guttata TaxID=4155 RepID=A0A022RKA6_ERYGU|nr:hypothetical protein MIMGU_mgv11b002100mg [Erythranthe guttata]
MDQKSWLWKKRSTEKTLVADKASWEKAEIEAISLKQELDKVLQQKATSDERIGHLDAALKECMLQLRFVQKEQDKRVHSAMVKRSDEFEKITIALNEKLADSGKRLAKLDAENTQLSKALSGKEKVIEDLSKYRTQIEADFSALMSRVESTEKENASLKYELRVLEKELHIRNEEREYTRRMADSAQRAKLETSVEPCKYLHFLQEHSLLSASSDVGSEDKASCSESLASHRNMGASDMSLMYDFAEMEKLAVVSLSADNNIPIPEKSGQKFSSNSSSAIRKVIELVEGINIPSQDSDIDKLLSTKNSEKNPTGYVVRVFQWKSDELSATLQRFVRTCNDLLNGKGDFEQFVVEVASNLEWVVNHCFSMQDVSCMKDAIRNRLDWDESGSESEVDSGSADNSVENNTSQRDIIEDLNSEMETVKQFEGKNGNRVEKEKTTKGELENQFMDSNHEQGKSYDNVLYLEHDLENKDNSCERLEETCYDLNKQLKSEEVLDNGSQWEKQLQNDWEITVASEKLAECQETILNLGKQLKALASPSDAALFEKVINTPDADSVITTASTPQKKISHRSSSLLDKMLADDNNNNQLFHASPETEKDIQNANDEKFTNKSKTGAAAAASMDIVVPCKRNRGGSFFKKLFWRRKKGKSGKTLSS